jgi:hypothetical protein
MACKRYSAEQIAIDYSGRQLDEATAWQEVSASADFDAHTRSSCPPRGKQRGLAIQ